MNQESTRELTSGLRTDLDVPAPDLQLDFLHRISHKLAGADPLTDILAQIVDFINGVFGADSCFIYILEGSELVLRASKNPHPESVGEIRIPIGEGITGWVAQKKTALAIAGNAMHHKRFRNFNQLPEDSFEAILSVPILAGGTLVGVVNIQHRAHHEHSQKEIDLISTIGTLVGSEIERARLDYERHKLADQLENRKILERAKGILQRDLDLSEEQAYLRLQSESRRRRIPMKQVANAIVLADELRHS